MRGYNRTERPLKLNENLARKLGLHSPNPEEEVEDSQAEYPFQKKKKKIIVRRVSRDRNSKFSARQEE